MEVNKVQVALNLETASGQLTLIFDSWWGGIAPPHMPLHKCPAAPISTYSLKQLQSSVKMHYKSSTSKGKHVNCHAIDNLATYGYHLTGA